MAAPRPPHGRSPLVWPGSARLSLLPSLGPRRGSCTQPCPQASGAAAGRLRVLARPGVPSWGTPHSPQSPLTTPRAPSQRSPHSPQCPLTTLPSQPLLSPHPPSPLCLPPRPQQPPLLHTNEPLLPVSFQAVSSEALHKPLGVSGGISAPGRDSGWRQVANIHQG